MTGIHNDGYTAYREELSPVITIESLAVAPVEFGPKTSPIEMFFPTKISTTVPLQQYFTTSLDWNDMIVTVQ